MISTLLQVALGGALGAMSRFLVGIGVARAFGLGGFPLGVVAVNIFGSFLMGAFVVLAANRSMTHLSPFVMTGLLGGFTTFSAFSLEAVTLFQRGEVWQAVLYVALSVICAIGGLVFGMWLARGFFA